MQLSVVVLLMTHIVAVKQPLFMPIMVILHCPLAIHGSATGIGAAVRCGDDRVGNAVGGSGMCLCFVAYNARICYSFPIHIIQYTHHNS